MNDGIHKLFTALAKAFGEPHWWPADTPFEVMVGAILTQPLCSDCPLTDWCQKVGVVTL